MGVLGSRPAQCRGEAPLPQHTLLQQCPARAKVLPLHWPSPDACRLLSEHHLLCEPLAKAGGVAGP